MLDSEFLFERLREYDLILSSDARFPSVSNIVIGDAITGSWWAHPAAHDVFRLSCELIAHPDVLRMVLVSGKVTLVHRPLWPAVFAIGTAREPWQMSKLSKEARTLLEKIDKPMMASGDAVRELEKYVLIQAESVHTERGTHAKQVQSWRSWAKSVKLGKVRLTQAEARLQIEQVVARLNKQFGATGTLPWQSGAGPLACGRRPRRPS